MSRRAAALQGDQGPVPRVGRAAHRGEVRRFCQDRARTSGSRRRRRASPSSRPRGSWSTPPSDPGSRGCPSPSRCRPRSAPRSAALLEQGRARSMSPAPPSLTPPSGIRHRSHGGTCRRASRTCPPAPRTSVRRRRVRITHALRHHQPRHREDGEGVPDHDPGGGRRAPGPGRRRLRRIPHAPPTPSGPAT